MLKNQDAVKDMKEVWENDWPPAFDRYFWYQRHRYLQMGQYLRGNVLDIGCGPGYLCAFVEPNENHYHGVDISQKAIDEGKKLFPGAFFTVADVSSGLDKFSNNSFKTVVLSEVVEHIENYKKLLNEAVRISSEYILITVPVDMPQPDHIWPKWDFEDIEREFGFMGKILEIKRNYEYNFNIIWIRK